MRERINEYPAKKRKDCVSKKKRLTRQQLSNTATELFIKQGFDNVTVSDIAAAAKVSKMTVFNYFPRKEELYFDRIDEIHQLLQDALERPPYAGAGGGCSGP
ncbi:HTH-type transcriptional regulator luxR [Raoultella planticola]|uniref:HTH-type transcriptional regulator luxR n=1 Tax=Raoultella planticola TaxID=575 RepID=A0A485BS17_RAOPL|nr:HTH-type transcriptional regulator luxR [Raoultella planticola]